jgi:hypothetical protein
MRQKEVAIEPSPELIDVLWGSYYLATGSYAPIGRMIKLLPLANDKDSVDNLTTGSAAKFTLASNAVRGERTWGRPQDGPHLRPYPVSSEPAPQALREASFRRSI